MTQLPGDINVTIRTSVDDQTARGAASTNKNVKGIADNAAAADKKTASLGQRLMGIRGVALAAAASIAGISVALDRVLQTYRASLLNRGASDSNLYAGDERLRRLKTQFADLIDSLGPPLSRLRVGFIQFLGGLTSLVQGLVNLAKRVTPNITEEGAANFLARAGGAIGLLDSETVAGIVAQNNQQAQYRADLARSDANEATQAKDRADALASEAEALELLKLQLDTEKALAEIETDPRRVFEAKQRIDFLSSTLSIRTRQLDIDSKEAEYSQAKIAALRELNQAESDALATRTLRAETEFDVNQQIEIGVRLREQAAESIREAADLQSTGAISQLEAIRRQNEAIETYREKIAAVVDELKNLRFLADGSQRERIDAAIEGFNNRLNEIPKTAETVGQAIYSGIQSPLENLFVSAAKNFRDFRSLLADFASAIADVFLQLAARIASVAILNSIFGDLSGSPLGSLLGSLLGVALPTPNAGAVARNRGGLIPGGGPDRDSVLAALTPGEFVVNRSAVDAVGLRTLEAINRLGTAPRRSPSYSGGLPGFNSGGAVSAGVTDRPGVSVVAPTEAAMSAMLAGGNRPLLDAIRRNANAIRSILRS